MIFADMQYDKDYWNFHDELKVYLSTHFSDVECGLQGDSWFWIHDGDTRVAIDTFSSLKHQVKSDRPGPHVDRVMQMLGLKYKLSNYPSPVLEGHEDG